jgi:hypothetical protein
VLRGTALEAFKTKLQSLQAGGGGRRTRTLAAADAAAEVDHAAQLAHVLIELHVALLKLKDPRSGRVLSKPFQKLPPRNKFADYYVIIKNPVELLTILEDLREGRMLSLKAYLASVNRVFANAIKYNKKKSAIYTDAVALRSHFRATVGRMRKTIEAIYVPEADQAEGEGEGELGIGGAAAAPIDDDVIACVCRRFVDEGEMVQCGNGSCLTWQHTDCIGEVAAGELYKCFRCEPPETLQLEIPFAKDLAFSRTVDMARAEEAVAVAKAQLLRLKPLADQLATTVRSLGDSQAKLDETAKALVAEQKEQAARLDRVLGNAVKMQASLRRQQAAVVRKRAAEAVADCFREEREAQEQQQQQREEVGG